MKSARERSRSKSARSEAKEIVQDRHRTHGDFADVAEFSQHIRDTYRRHPGWQKLSAVQREAMEYLLHKHARIMCGDANFRDHWIDQVGYLERVLERLS